MLLVQQGLCHPSAVCTNKPVHAAVVAVATAVAFADAVSVSVPAVVPLLCPWLRLIRGTLYPGLRHHPSVLRYPPVRGMVHDLFFWSHDHKEGGSDESRSKFNNYEVEACMGLAR